MKGHVSFRRLVTLEASSTSFCSVEVNGKRLFEEMKESTSASSAEQGNYREITALGQVVREHRARIHSLMFQWPQYDSLIPKVMPASCLPRRICDPQSLTPALPPITTHTASPNQDSHPPACTPSWASEVSSFTVSGEHPPSSSSSSSVPPHFSTPPWNYFYLAYFPPSLYIKLYTIYMLLFCNTSKCLLPNPLFLSPQPWCYSAFI